MKTADQKSLNKDMTEKKAIQKDFIAMVSKTISDFGMIEHNDSVLTAVSGGPDSVALVLSLLSIKKQYGLNIGIAHLNHMLRQEESLRDEAFVKRFAEKFDLVFHKEQKDVDAYAKKHGLSFEEAGRKVRYHFLKTTARNHGYTKIALGHNRDDNAEQVLMNLLRGSGPKGLSGIPAIRDNRYIRPLIQVSKTRIIDFLKQKNQLYMLDSSNRDFRYLRNKIRHELIPFLQTGYNPEIIDALDRLSTILTSEEQFLDNATQKAFGICLIKTGKSSVLFSKFLMEKQYPAVINRVLRKGIKMVKKDLKQITFGHIDDIIEFCFGISSKGSLDLPDRIRIYKDEDVIMIQKEDKPLREIGKQQKLRQKENQKKQEKET